MKEYAVDHVIQCSPEHYWTLWLDPDWSRTLLLEGLGYLDCTIEPVRIEGGVRLRDMTVTPSVPVPGAFRRVIGERMSYIERARFDGEKWSYTLSLPAVASFRGSGETELVALPGGRCRRTSRIRFAVDLPMIGARIATTARDNARGELDRGAAFVNRWLAEHPEGSSAT